MQNEVTDFNPEVEPQPKLGDECGNCGPLPEQCNCGCNCGVNEPKSTKVNNSNPKGLYRYGFANR